MFFGVHVGLMLFDSGSALRFALKDECCVWDDEDIWGLALAVISFGQFFEYELIGFSVVHIFLFLREDSGRFGFLYGFGVVFAVLAMAVGVW